MIVRMKLSHYRNALLAKGIRAEDPRTLKNKIQRNELPGTVEKGGCRLFVDSETWLPTWPKGQEAVNKQPIIAPAPIAPRIKMRNPLAAKILAEQGLEVY